MSERRGCYNVWCRGGLSTLVYVRAVVCKNCLVLNCAAQVRSYVTHALRIRVTLHKSDLGREERLLEHTCVVVRFVNTALRRGCLASTLVGAEQ